MKHFRNLSLRSKQTLIIMLTSVVVLLIACSAFVAYDTINFRGKLVESVSVLADVVGDNCAAALDFNDPKAATETLAALHANDSIVDACVYTREHQVFAVYQRNATAGFTPPAWRENGQVFLGEHLHLFRPIVHGSDVVGTIFVSSDLKELSVRLMRYVGIGLVVLLASLLIALLLSNRLQGLVSVPILQLARVARSVALEKNYSVRATKQSDDELGELVEGFNEMLVQIQQRDAALQAARSDLERRVEERTRELAESQSLYHSLVDQMPAGVFRKDAQGRYVFVNSWFCRSKEMTPEQILGKTVEELAAWELAQPGNRVSDAADRTGRAVQSTSHHQAIMEAGRRIEVEEQYQDADGKVHYLRAVKSPVFDSGRRIIGSQGMLFDITDSKEAEAKLEQVHRQLLETSRQAGMAEIATNVLHNVGNVLNSVNVSAGLVADSVKKYRFENLAKIVALLREHEGNLGSFITADSRGKHVPAYLAQLSDQLQADRVKTVKELDSLRENVEHIKEIVAMQQSYAKVGGVKELVDLKNLVEDGLRMNEGGLNRHHVEVIREFENVPPMNLEKHKILQILVNLLRNAKYACDESGREDRQLIVRLSNGDGRVRISVIDNGVGIPPENLTRIFNHGFTTRKGGHGFGLHSGALAAREMGGSLSAYSDGPGLGAVFILELPSPKS